MVFRSTVKVFCEYKRLSLIVLNNEHLCPRHKYFRESFDDAKTANIQPSESFPIYGIIIILYMWCTLYSIFTSPQNTVDYHHTLEYLTLQRHYKIFEDLADCSCIVEEIYACGLITNNTVTKICSTGNYSSIDKNRQLAIYIKLSLLLICTRTKSDYNDRLVPIMCF